MKAMVNIAARQRKYEPVPSMYVLYQNLFILIYHFERKKNLLNFKYLPKTKL
jgi:hypothetical protein